MMRGAVDLHLRPTRELRRQVRRQAVREALTIGAMGAKMCEEYLARHAPVDAMESIAAYRGAHLE